MSEIESVKPALTVTLDDGDFIINSVGPIGKAMSQAVLPLAAAAKRVTIIVDGEMKVMKRNPAAENGARPQLGTAPAASSNQRRTATMVEPTMAETSAPDVQDSFVSDLESGLTGEEAMGESPSPTPGPSDPVPTPTGKPVKRKPVIFQDAAAPPAPELAEEEMDRLLAEAQQAELDAAKAQEERRFQQQQAVQANVEPAAEAEDQSQAAQPRKRTRERQLATTGRACGRCGGGGKVVGDAGFAGACPVCQGQGQVKTWDRSLKVR